MQLLPYTLKISLKRMLFDVICIFLLELNDIRECGRPARSHVGWYNKAYRYFTDKGLPVTARDSP